MKARPPSGLIKKTESNEPVEDLDKKVQEKMQEIFNDDNAKKIGFKAKSSNEIDQIIKGICGQINVKIPIRHIQGLMYLVGAQR